jgi:hypothetical protein
LLGNRVIALSFKIFTWTYQVKPSIDLTRSINLSNEIKRLALKFQTRIDLSRFSLNAHIIVFGIYILMAYWGADTKVAFTYACPKNEDFSDKTRSVRQPDVPTILRLFVARQPALHHPQKRVRARHRA